MPISRDELLTLLSKYASDTNEALNFCFRYLNFYAGLLSAILAATITALFKFELEPPISLVLLTGPALIGLLARYGYKTVLVFYRRFIEGWITSLNIEFMLGLREELYYDPGVRKPLFASKFGGSFITQFERTEVRNLMDLAKDKEWTAEELLERVVLTGDTLKFSKRTFLGFGVAALVVAIAVIAVTFAPESSS